MRFLYFLIVLVCCSCQSKRYADLLIENDFIEIENARVFDTLFYDVKIMNLSSSEIQIDKLMTSCECVFVEKTVERLRPNQIDSIRIRFIPESEGYISRGFSIKYNKKVKNVIIEGYVKSIDDSENIGSINR